MKKIFFSFLSLALLTSMVSVGGNKATAASSFDDIDSPEKYIQYLERNNENSFSTYSSRTESADDKHLQDYIEQFKNLPEEQQEQFVDYLSDPEFFKDLFDTAATVEEEGIVAVEGYQGDVSIVTEAKPRPESFFAPNAVGDFFTLTVDYYQTYTAFGLNLIETVIFLQIETKEIAPYTSIVNRVLNSYGAISHNYYPPAVLTKSEQPAVISATQYEASKIVLWQWNFLWKNLGFTAGTFEQTLRLNKAGAGSYSQRKL